MARTVAAAPKNRQMMRPRRQDVVHASAVAVEKTARRYRRYRPSADAVHSARLLSYEAVVRRITSGACDASTLRYLEAAAHAHLRSLYGERPHLLFHVPVAAKDVLLAQRIAAHTPL